ncbi:MAG: hypothetical protein OSA99_11430, partial [Acidimicrobiales bacterium]|nr:hypothetical protein [Acidimicrobiales bacterium]
MRGFGRSGAAARDPTGGPGANPWQAGRSWRPDHAERDHHGEGERGGDGESERVIRQCQSRPPPQGDDAEAE